MLSMSVDATELRVEVDGDDVLVLLEGDVDPASLAAEINRRAHSLPLRPEGGLAGTPRMKPDSDGSLSGSTGGCEQQGRKRSRWTRHL
jgi:hypothetical protein